MVGVKMKNPDIGDAARAIIGRLAVVTADYGRFQLDQPRAEAALMRHLRALGQPERPVRCRRGAVRHW